MKTMMLKVGTLLLMLILPFMVNSQDKFSTKAAGVTVAGTSYHARLGNEGC